MRRGVERRINCNLKPSFFLCPAVGRSVGRELVRSRALTTKKHVFNFFFFLFAIEKHALELANNL